MEKNVYHRQYKHYQGHWWFEGKKYILDQFLRRNISKKCKILDYGCGVGINLDMLSKYGDVYYYDNNKLAINYIRKKNKNKKKFFLIKKILDKRNKKKFDLIIASDVIEHIKNDKRAIFHIYNLLKKNGLLLITVPAYQFLFSSKDKTLKHYRRYNKKNLSLILNNYFNKINLTYYNFILFLPISILILFFKFFNINFVDNVEKKPYYLINKIAYYLFILENFIIKKISLPFGLSLLFLGKKND